MTLIANLISDSVEAMKPSTLGKAVANSIKLCAKVTDLKQLSKCLVDIFAPIAETILKVFVSTHEGTLLLPVTKYRSKNIFI